MADAIPVHPTKADEAPKKPAPKKDSSAPKKVDTHIPAAPGNYYELPDGTVVRDN